MLLVAQRSLAQCPKPQPGGLLERQASGLTHRVDHLPQLNEHALFHEMGAQRDKSSDPKPPQKKRHFLAYKRRWIVWGSMGLLVSGVIAYNILTEDERIRLLIQNQASSILGIPVEVKQAHWSIFRGLSVRDVTAFTDDRNLPDSRFFHADALNVVLRQGGLFKLLVGSEPVEIVDRVEAQGVNVLVSEDMADHSFNLERLIHHVPQRETTQRTAPEQPNRLPRVVISDATVTYARRTGPQLVTGGAVQINGSIDPMPARRYGLQVIAKTPGSQRSMTLLAVFDPRAGDIVGRLNELHYDYAAPSLLPSQVQDLFNQIAFAGQFSIPRFSYHFARGKQKEQFDITLQFDNVRARLAPRFWLTHEEQTKLQIMQQTIRTFDLLGLNAPLQPGELAGNVSDAASPLNVLSYLQLSSRSVPLQLEKLSGQATFSTNSVKLENVRCELQGQSLVINGLLDGHDIDDPAYVHVQTAPGTYLEIPPSRQFLTWLPEDIRKVYLQFLPQGKAALDIQLSRTINGGAFIPIVNVDVHDASFVFDEFPYPLREATGHFLFERDRKTNEDLLHIQHLRGRGVAGGPNQNSYVEINGTVGPFIGKYTGVDLYVAGQDISSEPPLRKAFPPEDVGKAMLIFAPPDYGQRHAAMSGPKEEVPLTQDEIWEWPHFFGDFSAHINRPPGPGQHWTTDVFLDIKKAAGTLKVFPYPMDNLSCKVHIHDDQLTLSDLKMQRKGATLEMGGTVKFGDPADPDLQVKALNVPIDSDLFLSLPPTERSWVQRYGLGGRIDIVGRVYLAQPVAGKTDRDVDFDLNLGLHNAAIQPKGTREPIFTDLNGDLFLKPARLDIHKLTGRRGDGSMVTSGQISWADGTPDIQLKLNARNLLLDSHLREILPPDVQESWDQQKPEGKADIDLKYTLLTRGTEPGVPSPTDKDVTKLSLALRPLKMSATPSAFPLRLDNLEGEILIEDNHLQLKGLKATHGDARIAFDGTGTLGEATEMHLTLQAQKLHCNQEVLKALPSTVSDIAKSMQMGGDYDIRVDNLAIRPSNPNAEELEALRVAGAQLQPITASPATKPTTRPSDVDFDCTVSTSNGNFSITKDVTVTDYVGWAHIIGQIRADQLMRLDGSLNGATYKLLGRPGSDFQATLRRPPYSQELLLENLQTRLAGGSVAGGVALVSSSRSGTNYTVDINIRNADVNTVAQFEKPMNATISASMGISGTVDNPARLRGHGEIHIEGQSIYQAPLMLGLYSVVNLSLPGSGTIKQVDITYDAVGDLITVSNIEMTGPGTRIYGSGKINLKTRTLDFILHPENANLLTSLTQFIPGLGDLIKQGQKELLEIHLGGTLSAMEVKPQSLPTFRGTFNKILTDAQKKRR